MTSCVQIGSLTGGEWKTMKDRRPPSPPPAADHCDQAENGRGDCQVDTDDIRLIDLESYVDEGGGVGDGTGGSDDVFLGEGAADLSSIGSVALACSNLNDRPIEDDVALEGLFHRCIEDGEGKVLVLDLMEQLKSFIDMDDNVPRLLDDLWTMLDANCRDGLIDLDTYCSTMHGWVRRLRNPVATPSDGKTSLKLAVVAQVPASPIKFAPAVTSSFSISSSVGILNLSELNDTSNDVVDGAIENLSMLDNNELCHKICEERFKIKRLHEQLLNVRVQATAVEDQNNSLLGEREDLLGRLYRFEAQLLKSREVDRENQDLRDYLIKCKEKLRQHEKTNAELTKENTLLESRIKNVNEDLRLSCSQVELFKLSNEDLLRIAEVQKAEIEEKEMCVHNSLAKLTEAVEKNKELGTWLEQRKSIIESLREEKVGLEHQLSRTHEEIASLRHGLYRMEPYDCNKRSTDEVASNESTPRKGTRRMPNSKRQKTCEVVTASIFTELSSLVDEDLLLPSPFCERRLPPADRPTLCDITNLDQTLRLQASNEEIMIKSANKSFSGFINVDNSATGFWETGCHVEPIEGDEGLGSREEEFEDDDTSRWSRSRWKLEYKSQEQSNREWEREMGSVVSELEKLKCDANCLVDSCYKLFDVVPTTYRVSTPTTSSLAQVDSVKAGSSPANEEWSDLSNQSAANLSCQTNASRSPFALPELRNFLEMESDTEPTSSGSVLPPSSKSSVDISHDLGESLRHLRTQLTRSLAILNVLIRCATIPETPAATPRQISANRTFLVGSNDESINDREEWMSARNDVGGNSSSENRCGSTRSRALTSRNSCSTVSVSRPPRRRRLWSLTGLDDRLVPGLSLTTPTEHSRETKGQEHLQLNWARQLRWHAGQSLPRGKHRTSRDASTSTSLLSWSAPSAIPGNQTSTMKVLCELLQRCKWGPQDLRRLGLYSTGGSRNAAVFNFNSLEWHPDTKCATDDSPCAPQSQSTSTQTLALCPWTSDPEDTNSTHPLACDSSDLAVHLPLGDWQTFRTSWSALRQVLVRWIVCVALLLGAVWCLLDTGHVSDCNASSQSTCHSGVGGRWFSAEELLRPFVSLRHYAPPPV